MAFSQIDFVTGLFLLDFNPIAKSHLEVIANRFKKDEILGKLITLVDEVPEDKELTSNQFDLLLSSLNLGDSTNSLVSASYDKVLKFDDNEKDMYKKLLSNVICDEIINHCRRSNTNDPLNFIRELQEFKVDNLTVEKNESYREVDLNNINIEELKKETEQGVIKSSLSILNDLSPLGGIPFRSLIMVSGPPGSGKTLLMIQEALALAMQGKKVYYAAIGDMNEFSFMTRIVAQALKVPILTVTLNYEFYYRAFITKYSQFTEYFKIAFIAPDDLSCSDLMSILRKKGYYDEYTGFFIDYDTNFKSDEDMYSKGGTTYNMLKKLADRPGKVCYVGCQPNKVYWGAEILPLDAASESTRKQHIVDIMITVSHPESPGNINHIGIINVPKYRNGSLGYTSYLMDRNMRIEPISREIYQYLKVTTDAITLPDSGCSDVALPITSVPK